MGTPILSPKLATVVQAIQNGDLIHLVVREKRMPKLKFLQLVPQRMRTISQLEGLR